MNTEIRSPEINFEKFFSKNYEMSPEFIHDNWRVRKSSISLDKYLSSLAADNLPSDEECDPIINKFDEISQKLLDCNNCLDPDSEFIGQLEKLEQCYKMIMEKVSSNLYKWSELREKTIRNLQSTLQRFSFLKETTTGITRLSSTLEFAASFGALMQGFFHFSLNPKVTLLTQVVGGLSITYSFSALMYSKNSVEDIIRDLRNEKYLLMETQSVYRRAHWIDTDVQKLFPHGIDLKLVAEKALDADGNLVEQWEQAICTTIILTNCKKDRKLMFDKKFLLSVKDFARSTAAHVWINRIQLRRLLDYMAEKLNKLPGKKTINGNEVFLNLAAINIYPLFFSILCDSRKLRKLKFLWNSVASVSTALSLKDTGDFEDMKATLTDLQKDYRHIKKILYNLDANYN